MIDIIIMPILQVVTLRTERLDSFSKITQLVSGRTRDSNPQNQDPEPKHNHLATPPLNRVDRKPSPGSFFFSKVAILMRNTIHTSHFALNISPDSHSNQQCIFNFHLWENKAASKGQPVYGGERLFSNPVLLMSCPSWGFSGNKSLQS